MKTTKGGRPSSFSTVSASSAVSESDTSGPVAPMRKAPVTQSAMPRRLRLDTISCKKTWARIADSTTLHAPRGATREAGAKPKAAKLPTSPAAMRKVPIHQVGSLRKRKPSGFGGDCVVGEAGRGLEGVSPVSHLSNWSESDGLPPASLLWALFCRVREQAIRVLPHMASRKPIILPVPTDTTPDGEETILAGEDLPEGGWRFCGKFCAVDEDEQVER